MSLRSERVRSCAAKLAAVLLLFAAPHPARAAWTPGGSPLVVAPNDEVATGIVSDGSGGAIVVWGDNRTGSDINPHWTIYAQHVLSSGDLAPGWPSDGLPLCTIPSYKTHPVAVPDGAGGVLVFWGDWRDSTGFYGQRVTGAGDMLWAKDGVWVGPGGGGSVISDGAGGAVFAWSDVRNTPPPRPPHYHLVHDVYAQRVGSDGVTLWQAGGVAISTGPSDQYACQVMSDGAGGYLVTWIDGSVHIQHLDSMGTPLWIENGKEIPGPFLGVATADGAGGVISAFMTGPDTQGNLFAQRLDAAGDLVWPLGGVLLSDQPYDQRPTSILSDGVGGAFIAWHDLRNGSDWDVYATRITSSGGIAPGWPVNGLPICTRAGFQIYPVMISDGSGGVLITWQDARNAPDDYDIYAQRVTAAGTIATGWPSDGVALSSAPGHQIDPLPVADGAGGMVVAWTDYRVYADVYAMHVSANGVTGASPAPMLFAVMFEEVTQSLVRLIWFAGGQAGSAGTVYRRGEQTDWSVIARVNANASEQFVFEDRSVVRGNRYAYRIGVSSGGQELSSPETWVDVPLGIGFSFEGARPNPALTRNLTIAFELAGSAAATLELFDTGGRKLGRWSVGGLGAGPHLLPIETSPQLRAGVYLLRLTQGRRTLVRRACVLP